MLGRQNLKPNVRECYLGFLLGWEVSWNYMVPPLKATLHEAIWFLGLGRLVEA